MAAIDSFVEIFITKGSQQIDITSFSIPLVLTEHTAFPERARVYNSLEGVAEDFDTTSSTYQMALQLFGQQLVFPEIVVGRKSTGVTEHTIVVETVSEEEGYDVTIDGVGYTYTSEVGATEDSILAGLLDAVSSAPDTEVRLESGAIVVGTENTVTVGTNMSSTSAFVDESYTDAIFEVQEENDNWYALVTDSHAEDDVRELAATIQALGKIYLTSTSDAAVRSPMSQDDIASFLRDTQYDRTAVIWSASADTQFPEAAWLYQLLEVPGSNTWAMKGLSGVTVDRLSETDVNTFEDKNVNYFRTVKGAAIMMTGAMADGTWIDETVFIDWWKARVQEAVFFRMINTRKIPYTTVGAAMIEAEIRAINNQGIVNGGIAESPAPTVQSPNVLAIPEMVRATRVMGDFIVTFRLAGAVHKVSAIRATVSV